MRYDGPDPNSQAQVGAMLPARFDALHAEIEAAITKLRRLGDSVRASLFGNTAVDALTEGMNQLAGNVEDTNDTPELEALTAEMRRLGIDPGAQSRIDPRFDPNDQSTWPDVTDEDKAAFEEMFHGFLAMNNAPTPTETFEAELKQLTRVQNRLYTLHGEMAQGGLTIRQIRRLENQVFGLPNWLRRRTWR